MIIAVPHHEQIRSEHPPDDTDDRSVLPAYGVGSLVCLSVRSRYRALSTLYVVFQRSQTPFGWYFPSQRDLFNRHKYLARAMQSLMVTKGLTPYFV